MRIKLLMLIFFLCVTPDSFGITIGSNYYVSREDAAVFPSVDTNNKMKGFATFGQGFRLEDSNTICTFGAYSPVGGLVNLSGGTFVLNQDLTFDESLRFIIPGYIFGNNHIITFPQVSSNLFVAELDSGQIKSLQNLDSVTLSGNINGVDWSYDSNYVAVVTHIQSGQEVQVFGFNGATLTPLTGLVYTQDVYKVRWHPSEYYFATVGDRISGTGLALYQLSGSILSRTDVQDLLGNGYAVAWHDSGNYLVTGSDYASGELMLWNFDSGTVTNMQTLGLAPDRQITSLSFSPGGNYLAVGTLASGSEPTVLIYKFDGSTLSLDSSINTVAPVQALDWSPTGTYIAVGLSSGTSCVQVYAHDAALSTLTLLPLSQTGEVNPVLGVQWSFDGNFLVYGTNNGSASTLPAYKATCFFNQSTEELLLVRRTTWIEGISDIRWSPDNNYVAYGAFTNVNVDAVLGGWPLQFNNTNMVFKSNINVNSVWKFSGSCIVNGGLFNLAITDGGRIEVTDGAQVTFKDVSLKNINTSNFFCLTNNASIVFDNSTFNLSRDFTFTRGSLLFQTDVTLAGTNKFSYASSLTSTIASGATLYLNTGMTFSYDPPINKKDLLQFIDQSSSLYITGATIHATKYGMRFTNGKLFVQGTANFESEQTQNGLGTVEFGNQQSVHDFGMQIGASGLVNFRGDTFVYGNIDPTLWEMSDSLSVININTGASLDLQQTLDLGAGRLFKEPGAKLIRDNGNVKIIGAVNYTT